TDYQNSARIADSQPKRLHHAGSHADKLSSSGMISDDATSCGLSGVRLPKDFPCLCIHGVDLASKIGSEYQSTGCRRHAGEHRMRRSIFPADLARLRVERRQPPLRLIRRIEDIGKWVLVTEPKPSRRRDLDITLKPDVRAPVHPCNEERICIRAE